VIPWSGFGRLLTTAMYYGRWWTARRKFRLTFDG